MKLFTHRLFSIVIMLAWVSLTTAQAADFAALMKEARALDARNENTRALAVLQEAEKLQPNDPALLRLMAKQYSQLVSDVPKKGQKEEMARQSVAYAERSVEADPRNAEGRLGLAICYGRLALFESPGRRIALSQKVKSEAEAALRLDPKNDYAWHIVGRWHYEMATLNPALRLIAETIYGRFPDASLDEAIAALEKAVAVGPPRVVHHIELGRAYLAAGRTAEGRTQIEKGLRLPSREKDDEETKVRGRQALAAA